MKTRTIFLTIMSCLFVGLAAGAIHSAVQAVAGVPGVFLAGHLQEIAGVDGEDTRFRNLDRVKRVRQSGKDRVVRLYRY